MSRRRFLRDGFSTAIVLWTTGLCSVSRASLLPADPFLARSLMT